MCVNRMCFRNIGNVMFIYDLIKCVCNFLHSIKYTINIQIIFYTHLVMSAIIFQTHGNTVLDVLIVIGSLPYFIYSSASSLVLNSRMRSSNRDREYFHLLYQFFLVITYNLPLFSSIIDRITFLIYLHNSCPLHSSPIDMQSIPLYP